MRVFLVHVNRWWDTETYLVEDPTDKELQLFRTGYVPDGEVDVPFPHTDLEKLLEQTEWQAKRTWRRGEVEDVDLVVFCGGLKKD